MSHLDAAISEIIRDYVEPHISSYNQSYLKSGGPHRPFILGLTGLQGSGKSTWALKLVNILHGCYNYNAITVSLDDLYHEHANLVALAGLNPTNILLQTRGQPGTHDERLAIQFFESLLYQDNSGRMGKLHDEDQIWIPSFDKSKFGGEGDRKPRKDWLRVSTSPKIDVVVFEGWCIGFQPLQSSQIYEKWELAKEMNSLNLQEDCKSNLGKHTVTLQDHLPQHLETINQNLRRYCSSFMGPQNLDYLLHLDTDDLHNVYDWRLQQEQALRRQGTGAMSDEAVATFVKGYMPAYELYLENLREAFFTEKSQCLGGQRGLRKGHIRALLDRQRRITSVVQVS